MAQYGSTNPAPGRTGAAPSTRPGGVSEGRKIELIDARWRHSTRYNQGLFAKLQRWYDTYRGVWTGRSAQFRNNVNIPFTFAMIQSDVARKVQTSFGAWPIVSFEGYAPEDVARAKKNEILISAQMKDAGSVVRAVDFFLQADICGTAVARIGWKHLARMNRIRRMEQVAPGFSIPVVREEMAELFNGPVWEPVDRLDFGQQPGKVRIEDMAWVCHRYYADWDDLWEDANSDYPYFDREAVWRLKQHPMDSNTAVEFGRRRVVFRNEYDYQVRQQERFGKPVEIIEMHGLVPREFAPDGIRHRCMAMANGHVIIKDREGPLGNQQKPFLSYSPMPDPYSFDGVAKTEVAFGPQQTANRLANQKLDALDHLIDPMYIANANANLNTQHLFTRAGRIILVDGNADESNIRALTPDMRGLQAAYAEVSQLFQFMQLGTGETESLLGGIQGNRETARGALTRQENALTRLTMESRIAEEGFIEPLANMFRHMDQMWLTLPHEVKILGSLATTNPTTGLPYEQESATVDYDDLAPDYRARAVGASQMIGRSIRQQNLLSLLQMMSANPALIQLVNWANFARQAFEVFDFKNVNELLVTQVPMVNQVAAQSGTSPEAVAGVAASPLEQLSPDVLGQLLQAGTASPLPSLT